MEQKARPQPDAMERLLRQFHSQTSDLLDVCWDAENPEDAAPLFPALERLQAYLAYQYGAGQADLSGYLLDDGYTGEEVEAFFRRCRRLGVKLPCLEKTSKTALRERILSWFLGDTLALFENCLKDEDAAGDPKYSKVTCEDLILLYLECKGDPRGHTVPAFLRECGYTAPQIEAFYEKYRAECIWWYADEPREPVHANGRLRVYEVEGMYVIGIKDVEDGNVISPRGAEFDAARNCIWAYRLLLPDMRSPEAYLYKTLEELEQACGPVHVRVKLGKRNAQPAYVTNRGYLACFLFEGGRVSAVRCFDLCTPQPAGGLDFPQHLPGEDPGL